MTSGEQPAADQHVVVERRQLRGIHRAVIAVIVLAALGGVPLAAGQLAQAGTNDRLEAQADRIEAQAQAAAEQADRLQQLVDDNARDAELELLDVCISSHTRYAQFTEFMSDVRDAVQVVDQAAFDHLLETYPPPSCDLEQAQARRRALTDDGRSGR